MAAHSVDRARGRGKHCCCSWSRTAFALSLGPPPLGKDSRSRHRRRPGRQAVAAVRHGRRALASARVAQTTSIRASSSADRATRTGAFVKHPGVDRSALARADRTVRLAAATSCPAARPSPCRSRACSKPRDRGPSARKLRQMRARDRRSSEARAKTRSSRLSHARPLWRQSRGRAGGSLAYFGKEPRRLTLGEAALLVALPQSPEARRPDRAPRRPARPATACSTGSPAPAARRRYRRDAKAEPVPARRRPFPMLAPHAAEEAGSPTAPDQSDPTTHHRRATCSRGSRRLARDRAAHSGRKSRSPSSSVDHRDRRHPRQGRRRPTTSTAPRRTCRHDAGRCARRARR